MATKKQQHIFWVCPTSEPFLRSKGEIRSRPNSVIPKLIGHGYELTALIPYDPTLLPKSKLAPTRVKKATVRLSQDHPVEFIKLTRSDVSPSIFMVKTPDLDPSLRSALLSKSALHLAQSLSKPVDVFHLFGWETSLLPLFLEMERTLGLAKNTESSRTFLNVDSFRQTGTFPGNVIGFLGLPSALFHPEAMEFHGQVSYLKTGLLFSDVVGVIENGHRTSLRNPHVNGLGGVLNAVAPKLRRWASARSLKSHIDVYEELSAQIKPAPLLPRILERIQKPAQPSNGSEINWGPLPPDRYYIDMLSFLVQSPNKGFAFWEWTHTDHPSFGLVLDDITSHSRRVLADRLSDVGDFWIELEPDHRYAIEFVGWTHEGKMETLMRSRVVRSPRNSPSPNRNAVFIDVRSRQRFGMSGYLSWDELARWMGSSRAGGLNAGFTIDIPSSWKQKASV